MKKRIKKMSLPKKILLVTLTGFIAVIIVIFLMQQISHFAILGTATENNLIQNGTFTNFNGKQFPNWIFHLQGTGGGSITSDVTVADPSNGLASAKVTVATATPNAPWDIQLTQKNILMQANNSYQLLFDVKADTYRTIDVYIQQANAPYKTYYHESVPIGPNYFGIYPKAIEFTLPSILSDNSIGVNFNFGQTVGNIWLNKIQLIQLPNPHPVYLGMEFDNGMSQHDASKFLPTVQTEEAKVQHGFSIVTNYQGWGSSINNPFMTQVYENMRQHGSIPLITWMPQNSSEPTNCPNTKITSPCEPDYTLESIINGKHDSYIKSWADAAKEWGHPIMLRPMHEMNGDWYVWSEQQNGNKSGQFVQAWRHIVDIFKNDNVTNVTWVWCPNKDNPGYTSLSRLYPGDLYVDWTCIDVYNMNSGNGWQEFFDALNTTYKEILQLAPNKPMMIGETGTYENSSDTNGKANWITQAFTKDIPYIFPQFYAILYYDVPSECPQCKIDSSQTSLNAFVKAIQLPIYTSNTYANLSPKVVDIPSNATFQKTFPAANPVISVIQPTNTPIVPTSLQSSKPTPQITTQSPQQTFPTIQEQTQDVFPTTTEKNMTFSFPTAPYRSVSVYSLFLSPIIQINNTISYTVNSFFLHLVGR